jgi:hypothetical protein
LGLNNFRKPQTQRRGQSRELGTQTKLMGPAGNTSGRGFQAGRDETHQNVVQFK